MAAEETDPLYTPTPRKRAKAGRVPPVIEGEALEAAPPAQPEAEPAPAPEATSEPVVETRDGAEPAPSLPPQEPAPAQRLPLAGAVLLGAIGLGSGLFGAFQAQNATSEINDLRADIAGLRASGALASSAEQLAAMEKRIAALEQRPATATTAAPAVNPAELRALNDRVSALDASLRTTGDNAANALQTARRAADASARPLPPPVDLQPLEKRLTALELREAPIASIARRSEAAGLAIIAQSIGRALDQGAPFEPALASATALGADAEKLAPLQAVAKTGAPTARSLSRLWAEESRAALDAAQPAEAGQGWLDRLKSSAARVIHVRPIGEASGQDPAALGATIEAALTRGAAAQALAVWTKLPEPAREASRPFGEAARQLVAAQEAVEAIASGAVADLARSKGAQ